MNLPSLRPWIRSVHRGDLMRAPSLVQRLALRASTSAGPTTARQHDAPFRMAVIGSGPAGFYTAYRVMTRLPGAKVDMYESLPVPFGLVRFGVAPDHSEVKNCQDKFEEVASSANFTFVGNTTVGPVASHKNGCHVELSTILRHYDAVILAYGAAKDRTLGIPGESSLQGIYSARQFVGWYNGLPEYANLAPDLSKGDDAVIIGQGNVALDVARMLLENVDNLRKTDITEEALAQLSKSRVKRVHIVGRRGPMQAAFTIKEARELMKLQNVAFHPVDRSLIPPDLKALPRAAKRLMEVVSKGSYHQEVDAPRSWSLDFCLSPKEFLPGSTSTEVSRTVFERTELSATFDPNAHTRLSGETVTLSSSLVFRSIGYKSVALPGFKEARILFDDRRGIVMNDGLGRVLRASDHASEGQVNSNQLHGVYCAGWVKRGPTGVIASTMEDAFATGDSIVQDWLSAKRFLGDSGPSCRIGWDGVRTETDSCNSKVVHWGDWHKIDKAERERGRESGKEREKFTSTKDMLAVLV